MVTATTSGDEKGDIKDNNKAGGKDGADTAAAAIDDRPQSRNSTSSVKDRASPQNEPVRSSPNTVTSATTKDRVSPAQGSYGRSSPHNDRVSPHEHPSSQRTSPYHDRSSPHSRLSPHSHRSSPASGSVHHPHPLDIHRASPQLYPPPGAPHGSLHNRPSSVNSMNRPPSVSSVHSGASGGGAPRTTTTSRRGGRTRSRSPPTLVNRPGERGSFSIMSPETGPRESPINSTNPSSAAAAAAAAAKALSSNTGGHGGSSWYDGRDSRGPFRDRGGEDLSKFPGGAYDKHHYPGSRSWPPEHEHPDGRPMSRRSYGGPSSQSIHRGVPPSGSGGEWRHGGGSYGHEYHGSHSGRGNLHPPYDDIDDRRYGVREGRPYDPVDMRKPNHGRSLSPAMGGGHPADRYGGPPPPYYGGRGDGRVSPKGGPLLHNGSGGGMSRVIGTATPIHVPRASEPPPARHSRVGTPASVFRGRPGSDAPRREDRERDDDSPQKILLSLRTPTTSFEEKQPGSAKAKNGDLPPSPDEPPQIQNSHHQQTSDFFEPHRSPKSSSIEMAPSFNLFNQSFDSFGDTFNVVGPLDSSLQSASFGAGPTASSDNFGTQSLQRSMSGGNYTQQLLAGSGSGALTFGMSPVNSFGNGPPILQTRRSSDVIVLGGQDHRAASPTQVLGMYHSYSGGSIRPSNSMGPLDGLGAGSFGAAPSLSHNYTRSFGAENSPIMPYGSRMGLGHSHEAPDGGQVFYIFLRKNKLAFKECTFLLPGLKAALLEAPLSGRSKSGELGDDMAKHDPHGSGMYSYPSPQEIAIARRRVESAICAFGGSLTYDRSHSQHSSIFREKDDGPSTVTPSPSTGAPPDGRFHTSAKIKYGEQLPSRYYENENRLSWEFEENPPVAVHVSDDLDGRLKSETHTTKPSPDQVSSDQQGEAAGQSVKNDDDDDNMPGSPSSQKDGDNSDPSKRAAGMDSSVSDQPKMRYRCKLCGQPKQNHTCPFMQSLARSIGVNVYPSVNAFTAAEPGIVAPPLSEMNNFVASDDVSVASSAAKTSGHPTPDRIRHITGQVGSTQVTPESRRSKAHQMNSPSSTLSTGSSTPQRPRTPGSAARPRVGSAGTPINPRTPGSSSRSSSRKRRHSQFSGGADGGDPGDLLFVEAAELKQEQFRMVTPSKTSNSPDAYTYPALPLPYAQRKRLSDNLFSLSKKVPQLTDECAAVLREAREKDSWDLAVAELMTQVVVVIHCHDGDSRFEGLRQYLLTLGIAC